MVCVCVCVCVYIHTHTHTHTHMHLNINTQDRALELLTMYILSVISHFICFYFRTLI